MKFKDDELIRQHLIESINYIRENEEISWILNQMLINTELWLHSVNVAKIAIQLGIEYGCSDEDIKILGIGSLLHDIGKLAISEKILYKVSKLTELEFDIIKEHPKQGYKLLADKRVQSGVLDIVRHHHEKLDGSGYPDGITDIEYLTQIVTVADIFSALTESRCYHDSLSVDGAFRFVAEFRGLNREIIDKLEHSIID